MAKLGMNVLIVDDSPADAKLVRLWLSDSPAIGSLEIVGSGRAALQALRGEGEFADKPRPDLMLLDSNLPDMNGLEVLSVLQTDRSIGGLKVFVMSGSYRDEDAQRAMDLGADEYFAKPFESADFARLVEVIESEWSRQAE